MTTFDATLVWAVVAAVAAGTLALRWSFIGLLSGKVPAPVQRVLRFVPAAVLAALTIPALLRVDGSVDVAFGNHRLVAGSVAALIAWRTRNVLATITTGMAALWILDALW
jgi:branched-subunit amino acid transport protein